MTYLFFKRAINIKIGKITNKNLGIDVKEEVAIGKVIEIRA